jgi:hypothetical protein
MTVRTCVPLAELPAADREFIRGYLPPAVRSTFDFMSADATTATH